MKISTYKGEKTLSDLVDRLFETKAPIPPDQRSKVEKALLQLNPQLEDLDAAPAGLAIVVPEVEGLKPAEDSHPPAAALRARFETVRDSLGGIREFLEAAATNKAKAAENTLKQCRSKEWKSLARKDPEAAKSLGRLEAEAQARVKEARTFKALQKGAFVQIEKSAATLSEVMNLGSPSAAAAPPPEGKNAGTGAAAAKATQNSLKRAERKRKTTTERGGKAAKDAPSPTVIDVNADPIARLRTLPHVGTAVAREIVKNRPYRKVEELLKVPGIGRATLGKLKKRITLS